MKETELKPIEEMALIIGGSEIYEHEDYLEAKQKAEQIYNAGWRKQSENTVEVVRCKDCKYHRDLDGGVKCERMDGLLMTLPNDFCSYGERKE